LGQLSPQQLIRNVFREIAANNLFGRASELAFDFLFALFPLILFMLSLFGFFASRSIELQKDFLSYFADFVPPTAFQLLTKTTAELAANASGRKLTFGILLAVWFASGGVSSMISALNLSNRIHESRSWLRVRLIAVGLTVVIAILLLAALFIVVMSGHFCRLVRSGVRVATCRRGCVERPSMACCPVFRDGVTFCDLFWRAGFAKTSLALDNPWFGFRRSRVASVISCVQGISSLF
jgi:membrane protein